ncbi:MAG: alpha/beta hydrolase, partial [Nocardioidaceae bacterium]
IALMNPGGPGASGLIMSLYGMFVPNNVGNQFDWIGWDPRGVGSSTPSLTCDRHVFKPDRPYYVPSNSRLDNLWQSRSRHYARACGHAKARRLLDHVKTTDTVADMESIRKALHRKRITYYGFSYGTYLGQVYASLHPHRVRRMVLDSTVDPRGVWYRDNLHQDTAFNRNIKIYFNWLAKYDSVYHLGKSGAAIENHYYDEIRHLRRHPAGGVFGPDELADTMLPAGYYVFGWEGIAHAYAQLMNKHNYKPMLKMYRSANSTKPGGDNSYAMYLATQCTDAHWPSNYAGMRLDNWRIYAKAPFLTWANQWFNGGGCLSWPGRAARPVHVTGAHVRQPVLMIDETKDAATPYAGSLEVRSRFPTASLIAGVGGTTHAGSLSGDACIDNAIARYLDHGTTPDRVHGRRADKKCPPLPKPNPTKTAPSGRTLAPGADSALRVALRATVNQASLGR